MKQVLIYLVEFLKEQHGMSMSEMSKGLGRGRNFIREAITRGYENEDKYVDIMNNLKFNFFYSNDDNEFYMFMVKKSQQELYKIEIAGDKIIDCLHKRLAEMNQSEIAQDKVITKQGETIRSLEHRITMLNKSIDQGWKRTENQNEEIIKLNNTITTKDKFIDGQDEEIKGLSERVNILIDKDESEKELITDLRKELEEANELVEIGSNQIDRQNNTIESLKAVSRELGTENTNLQKRNRILVSMLIFFCVIDMIMAFLRHM